MPTPTQQVLNHIKQSLQAKKSVVAAPAGQPAPPPGMGGALPAVGGTPGSPIQPLGPMGAMPPEMMGAMPPEMMGGGAMPPEMMGAMPPEMMGGGAMPADPITTLQQEVSELRGLMQQLIDGQIAIIESLVGGSEAQKAPAAEEDTPSVENDPTAGIPMGGGAMPPEMMGGGAMPVGGAAMPPPMNDGDAELMSMIQQGLRA